MRGQTEIGSSLSKVLQQMEEQNLRLLRSWKKRSSPSQISLTILHTSSAQLPTSGTYINKFEKYQDIQSTEGASPASPAFEINNESLIVFGNYFNSKDGFFVNSTVYNWSEWVLKQISVTSVLRRNLCEILQQQWSHLPISFC